MIFFEVGKSQQTRHRSGLTRVSRRLLEEFGKTVTPSTLFRAGKTFQTDAARFAPQPRDWWLTAELFSEADYPGFWNFLRARRCRLAAIFHDAIPLKHPHITWPKSVSRHPEYMKMLAGFDRVFAVSDASRRELIEFWEWQGGSVRATVETLALGADFSSGLQRVSTVEPSVASQHKPEPVLLSVGIIEPRKNQSFLLDVCDALWGEGLRFELHLVGRVNPHFGPPIVERVRKLRKKWPGLYFHEKAGDEEVLALYRRASASAFPTIAEGCGLPLLESLWRGVPCVCSDLPVLIENTEGGGCLAVPVNDFEAWKTALRAVVSESEVREKLAEEARRRTLPTWKESAEGLVRALGGKVASSG